jgi:hypothetical protein
MITEGYINQSVVYCALQIFECFVLKFFSSPRKALRRIAQKVKQWDNKRGMAQYVKRWRKTTAQRVIYDTVNKNTRMFYYY